MQKSILKGCLCMSRGKCRTNNKNEVLKEKSRRKPTLFRQEFRMSNDELRIKKQ